MAGAVAPLARGGERRLLAAVGLTGSATLVTVALGVATTKVIALVAGPAGIALMGLYRNLGALVSRSLLLGLDTTLVQRISTARDQKTASDTLGAAILALLLQGGTVLLVGAFGAVLIGRWLFGALPDAGQIQEVRVVLAMAYVNLAMQVMTAALSGRVEVRKVAWVGVVAAVVTLAVIHPLLRLGRIGLALNVGSGSAAGAALATFFVYRTYSASWVRGSIRERFRALSGLLSRSTFLVLHPLVMMTAVLTVQSFVLARFALSGLGAYNASTTILDTALMVITASARTFFLPSLGQLDAAEVKAAAVNRVLRLNLILASAASLVATAGTSWLVPVLFSGRFELAVETLPRFSLALVGQAFVWPYAMFYLHQARYRLFFLLDAGWALAYVGLTLLATSPSGSLGAAAWAYAGSYMLSGLGYVLVAVLSFGRGMLDGPTARFSALVVAGMTGALFLHELSSPILDAALLVFGLAALGWAFRRFRGEPSRESSF